MPTLSPADNDSRGDASLAHVRTTFDFVVPAGYQDAFPLFGANGERSWAGDDWNPQFVYPRPVTDVPGAVFTIKHGSHQAVWVNTAFDLEGRHIQYTYLISDVMVTIIDLTFVSLEPASTKVRVVYERTALKAAANDEVRKFSGIDQTRGAEWEKAISAYLRQR